MREDFTSQSIYSGCRMPTNVAQAAAELPILRDFVDFLNAQLGVYIDCLSSFQGNKARVERQTMRIIGPATHARDPRGPVVSISYEDPTQPDIILHKITRASEYFAENNSEGYNERQIVWALIIFVFTYWDEDVRKRLAAARQIDPS